MGSASSQVKLREAHNKRDKNEKERLGYWTNVREKRAQVPGTATVQAKLREPGSGSQAVPHHDAGEECLSGTKHRLAGGTGSSWEVGEQSREEGTGQHRGCLQSSVDPKPSEKTEKGVPQSRKIRRTHSPGRRSLTHGP